jgi:hypothetical protein
VRPENVSVDAAGGNIVDVRVRLSAYLGSTLRYEFETAPGLVFKCDVRDPWHHQTLPPGHAVRLGFPASAALMLRDE